MGGAGGRGREELALVPILDKLKLGPPDSNQNSTFSSRVVGR